MKVIITPIGTSLITNHIDKLGDNEDVKGIYNDIKDKENIEKSDLEDIKGDLKEYLEDYSNSCAERTSIDKIKEEIDEKVKIIFIASDTQISKFLVEIFKDFYSDSEIKVIDGLQTDNKDKFEKEGLKNFIEFFKLLKSKELIFNITAGYKAFIPYLTIIGQLYNIPIKYIFEDSDKLISIPQLPIGFDDKIADLYLPYLNKKILNSISNSEIINKLIELKFVKKENDLFIVTALGSLFVEEMNNKRSTFGDLIELLLFIKFSQELEQHEQIEQGVEYELNCNNTEITGDIDIVIKDNSSIKLFEIKSFLQIKKFLDRQLKKYICFAEQEGFGQKEIILFVYLVDRDLLTQIEDKLRDINIPNDIEFKIQYIELPLSNLQGIIRNFQDIEIIEFDYR